jgi:DNA-binding IclR family transcriptional regulator
MSKIVERTLDFFELFAAQGKALGLTEIARLLDIPMSSCHDVVQSLQTRGYLTEVAPRGGYYPTMRLQSMAQTIARNDPLAQRAERTLAALRDTLDETVSLGKILSGAEGMHLMVFESTNPLRFHNAPGQSIKNLHATSAGKLILSHLPAAAFDAWLDAADLLPLTPATITSKDALRASIEAGKVRGWQRNDEESAVGVTTIGASFQWLNIKYFVTVAGPSQRMTQDLEKTALLLLQACRSLETGNFDVGE